MTKTVIGERFRSVFVASIASMAISYVLILTDNIVAGQFIGKEAVAAITLVSPIMTLIFFLSYMVADGLAMMFSYAKGKNNRVEANELFSMGVTVSIVTALIVTAVLVFCRDDILSMWNISPELMKFAVEYYNGLMFIALPAILNIYFYTIYIAEGEENICVQASTAMFIVNMVLDVVLGDLIGVLGISVASVIGNLVSFLYHVPYLFSKKCQLRFVRYFNGKEFWRGIFYSWYHSMDTLFLALLPLIFSEFVIYRFGENHLIVVTVIINMITLLIAIYTGIVDCLQPMICQYHAEGALHSIFKTMRLGIISTALVTGVLILFSFAFAEALPWLFGVERGEELYSEAVFAVRIFMPFTIFLGVTLMLSNYYIYIEELNLGALIKFLLLLILPSAGMFAGMFGIRFLWAGVGFSFIIALLVNRLLTRRRHGLLLIDGRKYSRQFSFDTRPLPENLPALMSELEKYFSAIRLDERQKFFWRRFVEQIFGVYIGRTSRKNFQLEFSLIPADDSIILIVRDNGEPENPLEKIGVLPFNIREKNYMISGDENKLVVVA